MKKISDIDKNFKIETKIDKPDIKFYDIKQKPFKIYGVEHIDGMYRRMPASVAENTSEGVASLYKCAAGGRVRFKTDSPYLALNIKYGYCGKMSHFAYSGSIGFDLYIKKDGKEIYWKSYIPPVDVVDSFEQVQPLDITGMTEIVINFPTYSSVKELYIGVSETATVCEPTPYKYETPIVYYGSSITQGGCSSRPGMTYQSIISRRFDTNFINLGFSGSAKGEDAMAEYIKTLPMSVFVYDYDYNAADVEHLKNTHERMYKIIREANPDLPIIMLGAPKYDYPKDRFAVIKATYDNAKARGENVYLLNGKQLMELAGYDGTVDYCHPNDLGFVSMAKAVGDVLEEILK